MNLRKIDFKAMNMQTQAREARNAYYRDWRAKNRDKVRKYNADYWTRKAERNEQAAAAEGR